MGFKFEWFDREIGAPTVTLAEYGLVFNSSAIRTLGKPSRILLGFDKEQLVIAVRPVSDGELPDRATFPFAERIRRGFARINSKDFIRYVNQYLPEPITKGVRCVARWDRGNNALLVDLKQVWDVNMSREPSGSQDK